MAPTISWIRNELKERFPRADLAKGVDLNKNGSLEQNERISDFNRNGVVGDHLDWIAFYKQNHRVLTTMKNVFFWSKLFSPDNPIHDVIGVERELSVNALVKKTYQTLGKVLRISKKRIARGVFTPQEKLKIVYAVIRSLGIKLHNNMNPLFVHNVIQKHLDCDTSSFVVLAVAHELGIRMNLVLVPDHAFLRYDGGKVNAFNIDYGNIYSNERYKKTSRIAPQALKNDVYLKKLDRRGLLALVYLNISQIKAGLNQTLKKPPVFPLSSTGQNVPNNSVLKDALRDVNRSIALNRRNASSYAVRGSIFRMLGQLDKAIRDINTAISKDPRMHSAWASRGHVYIMQGKYKEAASDFTKALSFKNDPLYYIARAASYFLLKKYREAIKDVDTLIAKKPTHTLYSQRGVAYKQLKEYAKALADFTKAIKLDSRVPQYYVYRAHVCFKLGRHRQVVEDLDKLIEVAPLNHSLYIARAKSKGKLLNYREAIKDYQRAIGLGASERLALVEIARCKTALGEHAAAIVILNRLIKEHKGFADGYAVRGQAHDGGLKKFNKALSDLNKAIELQPKNAIYYVYRAQLYEGMGKAANIFRDYRKAIVLAPKNVDAHKGYAAYLLLRGNIKRVLKAYDKAIALAPRDGTLYAVRGRIKVHFGNYRAAIADFNAVLARDPKRADVYDMRGHAKINASNYQGAIRDFTKAIAINPKLAESYRGRARAKFLQGKRAEALKDFNRAIALKPRKADYRYERGSLYASGGSVGRARTDFSKALELDPTHSLARKHLPRTRYIPRLHVGFHPRILRGDTLKYDARASLGARWNLLTLYRNLTLGVGVEAAYAAGDNRHLIDAGGTVSLMLGIAGSHLSLDVGAGYAHLIKGQWDNSHGQGGFFHYGLGYRHRISDRIAVGVRLAVQHSMKQPKRFSVVPGLELTYNLW